MKTSRFALAAAAGLLLSVAMTPAKAADLGGGCCADLEERVAELEATTARKGNRVVSLQIYGQVNKALLIWDDGVDSDAYIVDNQLASSRVGLKGKAQISQGVSAGYNIELEIADAQSAAVNNVSNRVKDKQGDDYNLTGSTSDTLILRQNNFWIENEKLGRLTVGHQSVASAGAFDVVVSNSGQTSAQVIGNSFAVREGGASNGGLLTHWVDNLGNPASNDNDVVRYDSPSIYGFILSAAWGDNDYADVALRFKKDFGAVRLAAALAYMWDGQYGTSRGDNETFGGSISAMHVPTGLYASFQASHREYDVLAGQKDMEKSMWYVQAGIERKMLPYGLTTIYGDYGHFETEQSAAGAFSGLGLRSTDYEATRWGFGVNQKIDAAAMDIYARASFYSFDDNNAGANHVSPDDMTMVVIGSKISF
jgi:hypothetical protein